MPLRYVQPLSRSLDHVGEFELLVLLSVRSQSGNAYSYTLQMDLVISARRQVCLGTICKTLHRLEARGLVCSQFGPTRPEPGGKRRRLYSITPTGEQQLQTVLERLALLWGRALRGALPDRRRQ